MNNKIKLPTILGVLILVSGIIAGVWLINSRQEFKLSANIEALPKNVRVSNITDNSVTVTWTTDIESNGFVKWGTDNNSLSKVSLEDSPTKSYVHSSNILGINSGSTIYFKINSNSTDYDNGGLPWQTKSLSTKQSADTSNIASGTVLLQDGKSPALAIVYLSINGVILSGTTSSEGNYVIPVSNYIQNIADITAIELTVNSGITGTSQAVIYPKALKAIPTIIIGKTYDFRSIEIKENEQQPKSSLSVPESIEISSRFEVQKNETKSDPKVVTLESIDNGEIIDTNNPSFFGSGPKNYEIQVSVESELQETAIQIDSKGKWSWSPPKDLEEGEHKITLKWKDTNGILRTITKNFIVSASEGPAFESTPSAILKTEAPSATPTSQPTLKPTSLATITPVASMKPTPETGEFLPTLGLFMMGIGILLSSYFIWKKSDVY